MPLFEFSRDIKTGEIMALLIVSVLATNCVIENI